jgi:hypothetical protein
MRHTPHQGLRLPIFKNFWERGIINGCKTGFYPQVLYAAIFCVILSSEKKVLFSPVEAYL